MTDWHTLRARIIEAFDGELPGGKIEEALVDLYEDKPQAVLDSIDAIAARKKAGSVSSGWAVLRKAAAERATRKENPTVAREKAMRSAEQWIRNAGSYIESEDELIVALFGTEQFTPPLTYLENIEAMTRGNPGRALYGPLLLASIERTREHGPQTVPDSDPGILAAHRTTKIRDQMIELWRECRPAVIDTELAAIYRADDYKRQMRQAAKPVLKTAELSFTE